MKRQLIVALLTGITTWAVVYAMRKHKYDTTWGLISRTQWEQIAAQLRDGRIPETPLDELQVLADVTLWLREL